MKLTAFLVCSILVLPRFAVGQQPLKVEADIEGGSVRVLKIDQHARSISFMPGGDPERGWPCWWYFRVHGLTPGETLTLRLQGSTASLPGKRPLSASWSMPKRAAWSPDGSEWQQTEQGTRDGGWMVYSLTAAGDSVEVAWGPPYTAATAAQSVRKIADGFEFASARELCRSGEGRHVPMLYVAEGDRKRADRFGVWVQARQHAWESGSSWVAQGFAEWLVSDAAEAAWLRQHAEIFVVPVMDVDNVSTGNGGKNAVPHDHNRDWSDQPRWAEVRAAQRKVRGLIEEGRMDVFLDLHNPAPGDPSFFYVLPREMLAARTADLRDQFINIAYRRISRIKPMIPMSSKPKPTGPKYHPLWKQMSSNWVAMHGNPQTVSLCLETIWNAKTSTTSGYRAVGASAAAAVQEFLASRAD